MEPISKDAMPEKPNKQKKRMPKLLKLDGLKKETEKSKMSKTLDNAKTLKILQKKRTMCLKKDIVEKYCCFTEPRK